MIVIRLAMMLRMVTCLLTSELWGGVASWFAQLIKSIEYFISHWMNFWSYNHVAWMKRNVSIFFLTRWYHQMKVWRPHDTENDIYTVPDYCEIVPPTVSVLPTTRLWLSFHLLCAIFSTSWNFLLQRSSKAKHRQGSPSAETLSRRNVVQLPLLVHRVHSRCQQDKPW